MIGGGGTFPGGDGGVIAVGGFPSGGGGTSVSPTCPGDAARAYQGIPAPVPGTVEAEDFDPAGYSDATPGNEGGAYRTDVDVDIKVQDAGHAIGWMTAGEWLEYTIDVPLEGDYQVVLRAGAVDAGRTLDISSCGTSLTGAISIPQIAAWGDMATTTTGPMHLAAGLQVIRVTVGPSDHVDLDSMSFEVVTIGGSGGAPGAGGAGSGGAPPTCPATFQNPPIWNDLADLEVIRVGDVFYYTASTMHYSPGAPVLRSRDLVHWEYVGHSVPVLDFDPRYDLVGGHSYVNGIWASTLQYRQSNGTFYWMGCMHNAGGGYVYTATAPEGPWTKHRSQGCYYDMGLLVDDDDRMYVAFGNNVISVAELTRDGFGEMRQQRVFTTPSNLGPLEGSRFYKIDGDYYIFVTQYANGEYVLRSTTGPFGPYELRPFAVGVPASVAGAGFPHQGGIVQTQNGDWYYMGFIDAYPGGRVPVLAPVTWSADGWPSVVLQNGAWGASYPFPNLPCGADVKPLTGTDRFAGPALGPEWEWNHNPDVARWSAGGRLTLQTATVTRDLYAARNTLTRRILGPSSTATIELDSSAMRDGDVAGLALLRDSSAWIGVKREAGAYRVAMVNDLRMDSSWNTTSTGTERGGASVSGGRLWLRVAADIRPGASRQGRFFYSTDGAQFTELGTPFILNNAWPFFLGYRFAIFNHATETLGGSVNVASFELATP